jgi:peroxiredoxin
MKKITLSFILSILLLSSMGQTTLTTAVDFTVTDTKGVTHNLFNYLNAGKYVCIDFFYKDCPACGTTAPYLQSTFENFGCNQGNVIILAVSSQDNDATLITYANANGYAYPMINSSTGGGASVHSTYGISATPTFILIAPDKNIVERDMWPLANAQALITYITNRGGVAQACVASVNETEKETLVSYPNPATNQVTVETKMDEDYTISIKNINGQTVFNQKSAGSSSVMIDVNQLSKGVYMLEVQSAKQTISKKLVIQ